MCYRVFIYPDSIYNNDIGLIKQVQICFNQEIFNNQFSMLKIR